MGGPLEAAPAPLTRGRQLLLGLLGFAVAGAVSATVALSGGVDPASAAPTPTASPVPTEVALRVLSVSRVPEQDGYVSMVVQNLGPAVRLGQVRVAGPGYGEGDGGGAPGLGVRGTTSLFVGVRPDCSAGIGAPRRPELLLEATAADGEERTLRLPLSGAAALPPELVGRCDAPLGEGARLAVRVLPSDSRSDVRLELALTAGRGMLWVDEIRGDVASLDPGGGPLLVPPGASEVVELGLRIGSCDARPAAGQLLLRREPGLPPRVVTLAEVGGRAYVDAVAAAFREVCG